MARDQWEIVIVTALGYIWAPDAWLYSDPRAEDYEHVVKRFFGCITFMVYYNGTPVCGRVFPK